jgi:Zn-dependent M28 family amino/carboxypeptidase
MRRALLRSVPFVVSAAVAPLLAAPPEPPSRELLDLQRAALDSRGAAQVARALADEVGPRLAGSPGDARAVAWAEAKLRELGFTGVHREPVTVPRWIRGEADAAMVAPWPRPLVVAALGGSLPTPPAGITARVVAVADVAALAALAPEAVRGRIVFIDQALERTRDLSAYARTVRIRSDGTLQAAAKGAAAVLIRSVGTDAHRLPHTGGMRSRKGLAPIPAAALAIPDANLLAAAVASGRPVEVRLRLTSGLEGEAESANVVGEIRGGELPDETVVLGAHLDSWDLGSGALDDAAGVGIVVEAALRLAALPSRPRRTIRVVLFANEEFGLSGARAYWAAHAGEAPRIQGALEADLGNGPVYQVGTNFGPGDREVADRLAAALAPLDIAASAAAGDGGADLDPLGELGVPVVALAHDATTYFDAHHSADDTAERLDPVALARSTAAYATVAKILADLPRHLGRALPPPPDEP